MDVSAITNNTTKTSYIPDNIGKDDFLRLLVTQLRYQDPLTPQKGYEFIAELAQFSSLEELQNINSSFNLYFWMMQSLNNSLATNLIGKVVKVDTNEITLTGDTSQKLYYELEGEGNVTVEIYDSDGNLVRTIEAGYLKKGEHFTTWDGKNDEGVRVSPGNYTFKVKAENADGYAISVSTFIKGKVTGIRFTGDGGAMLLLGDREVSFSDVIEILDGEEANELVNAKISKF